MFIIRISSNWQYERICRQCAHTSWSMTIEGICEPFFAKQHISHHFFILSLSIYLPIHLSLSLSLYPSIYLSITISLTLSIYLSITISLTLSIYLSLSLSGNLYSIAIYPGANIGLVFLLKQLMMLMFP